VASYPMSTVAPAAWARRRSASSSTFRRSVIPDGAAPEPAAVGQGVSTALPSYSKHVEVVEFTESPWRESVAAGLQAWFGAFLDECDAVTRCGEPCCGGGSGRSTPDDEDVGGGHGRSADG